MAERVFLTSAPLSVDEAYQFVVDEGCGAVCVFVGTVRNHNDGKKVVELEYSALTHWGIRSGQKSSMQIQDLLRSRMMVDLYFLVIKIQRGFQKKILQETLNG